MPLLPIKINHFYQSNNYVILPGYYPKASSIYFNHDFFRRKHHDQAYNIPHYYHYSDDCGKIWITKEY